MQDLISDYENTIHNITNRIKELKDLKRSDQIMNYTAAGIQSRIEILETERTEMIYALVDMKKHRPVDHRPNNKVFK